MPRPNILYVMTDQQRADAMGCSGGWVKTPNLDRIASEGVRFENAVTNSPVCIPARVSLATGRYPHNTTIWNNVHFDMPPDTPTWMQAVREAGYHTSVFGKTHLHHHSGDLRDREHLIHAYGLDEVDEIGGPRASARVGSYMTERWDKKGLWEKYQEDYAERFDNKPWVVRPSVLPLEEYADVYVGQQAKKYLESYDRDEPWFCWVSFGGPHEPWDTPEPYASMYEPEDMPPPMDREEILKKENVGGNIGRHLNRAADIPAEDIAAMRADYAANVTLIDEQIGQILTAVEDRGELENTVIIFSSDHGEMNGDHGMIYKGHFLNGALRVPLLVRTPETANGDVAGSVSESPVEWFDIGPTLVEAAGGELEHQQFARSLYPVLESPASEHRQFVVSEIHGEVMIMDRRWKLIFSADGEPYALFDQINDPEEIANRADDPEMKEIVDRMQEQLFQHIVRTQVRR
ncbi:MAG: sulfatase [Candidatus Brocadiia bacterium]